MAKTFTDDDDALLAELGVEPETKRSGGRSAREERIIAGFEEVQRFVDEKGHAPRHSEDGDIFERLYAVRLDRLREQAECRDLCLPLDRQGLLQASLDHLAAPDEALDDDALLAELGIEADAPAITELRHVRSSAERKAADEVANREACADFDKFKPLFEQVQRELDTGMRETRPFELKAEIEKGRFFIVGGQKAYVAEKGDVTLTDQGRTDARLRVIFDNGTESNMLMRSLQRALNKDEAGRRITDPVAGPLFSGELAAEDQDSGTIYILRSKSDHPTVAANRELVHKIGVTSNDVKTRIQGARLQPTFLMADVELVATYKLYNISRLKFEMMIHRIFGSVRLNIRVQDRFGRLVAPEEWFLVPFFVIDQAIEKIKDGTITQYIYDPQRAELVNRT
ncbi:GIY-YIG nuclease family protein [Paracoccus pantotrophus]|uniref:GIY-YIG nuclease family protein n=1 Tax=Paracoccus pantotrophus TaxID=82367 RepID=UPI000E08FBE3|nr:GIY-YIG nuclease family protein [Paracoccus pantotrophus]RDD99719.1 GIY-YIG nuclease family protein [Paracoccus pantotrophus]WGR64909.1 GIY-YIG nuclease family protein [Paracoccus pantotrophus]